LILKVWSCYRNWTIHKLTFLISSSHKSKYFILQNNRRIVATAQVPWWFNHWVCNLFT